MRKNRLTNQDNLRISRCTASQILLLAHIARLMQTSRLLMLLTTIKRSCKIAHYSASKSWITLTCEAKYNKSQGWWTGRLCVDSSQFEKCKTFDWPNITCSKLLVKYHFNAFTMLSGVFTDFADTVVHTTSRELILYVLRALLASMKLVCAKLFWTLWLLSWVDEVVLAHQ